jgi:hypothetical protein
LNSLIIIAYPVSNTPTSAVNNDIGLVFFSQTFGLSYGRALFSVFARNTLVAFATYCPTFFIGDHMLVPGLTPFAALRAVKKEFH